MPQQQQPGLQQGWPQQDGGLSPMMFEPYGQQQVCAPGRHKAVLCLAVDAHATGVLCERAGQATLPLRELACARAGRTPVRRGRRLWPAAAAAGDVGRARGPAGRPRPPAAVGPWLAGRRRARVGCAPGRWPVRHAGPWVAAVLWRRRRRRRRRRRQRLRAAGRPGRAVAGHGRAAAWYRPPFSWGFIAVLPGSTCRARTILACSGQHM